MSHCERHWPEEHRKPFGVPYAARGECDECIAEHEELHPTTHHTCDLCGLVMSSREYADGWLWLEEGNGTAAVVRMVCIGCRGRK